MKTIMISVNKYKVHCTIKYVKQSVGDIILLIGATTFSSTYMLFQRHFKRHNLIIINTPHHGKTNGSPLMFTDEYLKFYEDTISELISKGICRSQFHLLGYSLGGMALFHLIHSEKLSNNILTGTLLFSANITNTENLEKLQKVYESKASTFNVSSKLNQKFSTIGPPLFKLLPSKLLFTNRLSAYNDLLLCEGFNKLSELSQPKKSIFPTYIIGCPDAFFSKDKIVETSISLGAKYIPVEKTSHFAPLSRPKKYINKIEFIL